MERKPPNFIKNLTGDFASVPDDFDSYDAFIDAWQSFYDDEISGASHRPTSIQQVDNEAFKGLKKLLQNPESDDGTHTTSPVFANLANSAFLCDREARIIDANTQSRNEFGAAIGMRLDDLGLEFTDGPSASFLLSRVAGNDPERAGFDILKADRAQTGNQISIAVLTIPTPRDSNADSRFLVVILNTPWSEAAQGLIQHRYTLTSSEAEILAAFVNGISLKQIAERRGRSYTTIRNQFQSVLQKTGCAGQPELLILCLNILFLMSHLTDAPAISTKSAPRMMKIPRPNDRVVDVRIVGDPDGVPVLSLPSLFGHPVTPKIEEDLTRSGIKLLCFARPGIGGTSPPPTGTDAQTCFNADVIAFLNTMEIAECTILARASAARSTFDLLLAHPDRFSKAFLVNSLVPGQYMEQVKARSSWTKALITAARVSPSLTGMIVGSGRKLMMQSGARRFIKQMYRNSPADVAVVDDADVRDSISNGTDYFGEQNIDVAVADMLDGFSTWGTELGELRVPTVMISGTQDPNVPIDAARKFHADFAKVIDLIEVDGGGLLNYTHTDMIIEHLVGGDHA